VTVLRGTHVWRGLDEHRMEIVHIEDLQNARGTQIGLTYELRWVLQGDFLDLEVFGEKSTRTRLENADFFDVANSPFFNSIPVIRDGLLEEGPPRGYTMSFVAVPSLHIAPVTQRYEPLGNRIVRFSSGSFDAKIEFDADGLVTLYEDYLERLT
jgi:hypothetical protein